MEALCWIGDCEHELVTKTEDGVPWWHCPTHGRMRRLGAWYRDHEQFTHTGPAVCEAMFDPKGDRG